ncbi:hypothetical protein QVD17_30375 [Tagetes erecta]|uniref:Uncharacterized protein n=1 Tax=Tagetes erecta TaxID=13708 RepID=A0AAD8K589_TARER|nr:hypothetical protein QVD17_30375 [Tagetes erecta]
MLLVCFRCGQFRLSCPVCLFEKDSIPKKWSNRGRISIVGPLLVRLSPVSKSSIRFPLGYSRGPLLSWRMPNCFSAARHFILFFLEVVNVYPDVEPLVYRLRPLAWSYGFLSPSSCWTDPLYLSFLSECFSKPSFFQNLLRSSFFLRSSTRQLKGPAIEYTLDLGNHNLNGPIPENLADLAQLQCLVLSHNNLSGSIPSKSSLSFSQFGDSLKLQGLYLGKNQLSGTIPERLGRLSSLVKLNFTSNKN